MELVLRPNLSLARGFGTLGFDLSPDGNEIVFTAVEAGVWEIRVISLYGGAAKPVSAGQGHKADVQWSPAGDQFAFVRLDGGPPAVCVAPFEGGEPVRVSPEGAPAWQPSWSPEGDRLAFVAAPNGTPAVWFWTRESGRAQEVAPGPAAHPTWSPDGSWICYLQGEQADNLTLAYVSGWGGGAPRLLNESISGAAKPRWSPAGKLIAVTRSQGATRTAVVLSASLGSVKYAPAGADHWDPVWTSNGSAIAYRKAGTEGVLLEMWSLEDQKVQRLARPDGLVSAPHFTPGKPRAVFVWSRPNEPPELYVQIVQGGHPQRLTSLGVEGAEEFRTARSETVPGVPRAFRLGRPGGSGAAILWCCGPGEASGWNPVLQDLAASGCELLLAELSGNPAENRRRVTAAVACLGGAAPGGAAPGGAAPGARHIALVVDGEAASCDLSFADPALCAWRAVALRTAALWPPAPPAPPHLSAGWPDLPLALRENGIPTLVLPEKGDGSAGTGPGASGIPEAAALTAAHETLVRFLYRHTFGGE